MLKLCVLPTHFKVNLCVASFSLKWCIFFSEVGKKILQMEFMVQFCTNTFTIIYLWAPQDPANVLELFSIEFEPKIFSQIFYGLNYLMWHYGCL